MKKKNEEILPEQGSGTKMPAENAATNEVAQNENVKEETAEEKQEVDDSLEEDEGCMEFHASKKDFLLFVQKLLQMMKDVVQLEKSLHEFEKDPLFDMLLDLCMVHLQEMKDYDKDKESSEEECDDKKEDYNEEEDDDKDTIAVTHISMKVRKRKG